MDDDVVNPFGVSEAVPKEEVDKVALGQVDGAPKVLETIDDIDNTAVTLPAPKEDTEGEGVWDKDNEGDGLLETNATDGEASKGVSVPGTTVKVRIAEFVDKGDRETTEEVEGAKGVAVTKAVLVERKGEKVT